MPSKPDDFDVAPVRKKTQDQFTVFDVVTKLEQYSKLEVNKQVEVLVGIKRMLEKCIELIEKSSTRFQFDFDVTCKIFHLLPKLPAPSDTLKKVTQLLLKRIEILIKNEVINAQRATALLAAFAKLSLDIKMNLELIRELISNLEPLSKRVIHAQDALLSELWLFLAYARAQKYHNTKVVALFESVSAELATRALNVKISKFQLKVDDALDSLLSTTTQQDYKEEHPVGSYSLDMAYPSFKLNIEIDGPHHYRDECLSRSSKFRDYILQSLGWTIIRIPFFEWDNTTNKQSKKDYLLTKLANHTVILNEVAISRLKVKQVTKPDLMLSSPAHSIPIAAEETKADTATSKQKTPVSNNFISSSRYLNVVFAEKLTHKRYASDLGTPPSWSKVVIGKDTFFSLKKIKIKDKNRTAFERVASTADLVLKFKESASMPGHYKMLVNKSSPCLLRITQLTKATGFFNHEKVDNGNSGIIHLIREYEPVARMK